MNTDWQDVAAGLDDVGCAPTGPPVRHGVSTVRSGTRHALGLVLHDAA